MWRLSLAGLAALACVGLLAACGDEDDGDGGEPATEVAEVELTAEGGKAGTQFEIDVSTVASGAAEIELVNDSQVEIDGQLAYTSEEHSDEEVIAELEKAMSNRAVAEWFEGGGGPGATFPGESSSVTQELRPGTYYAVGVPVGPPSPPSAPLAQFEVTDAIGAELPESEATVKAVDYAFSADGLTAGPSQALLQNNGEQWHHFLGVRLAEGATIEDARRFFETEQGRPPFEQEPAHEVQSTVLEPGTSQITELDLTAGTYAFYCFVADKQGGPPHFAKGMLSEVEVSAGPG